MIWSAQRLKQSLKLTPQVLASITVVLLPLSILLWLMEYGVSRVHQSRFSSPMDSSVTFIVLFGLGAFILESLITVSWVILIAHSTHRVLNKEKAGHLNFMLKHFHQTLIEYVRALTSVGLYSLALIVPGLIRWVRLTFVCHISLFNKQYHQGKLDALHGSDDLTRGHFLPLFFLLILFALIPMGFERMAWSLGGGHAAAIGFFYLLSWLVAVVLGVYLTLTFFALAKKQN